MSASVLVDKHFMKNLLLIFILFPLLTLAVEVDSSWQSLAKKLYDESSRKNSIAQLRTKPSLIDEVKSGLKSLEDLKLALFVIQSLELKKLDTELIDLYTKTRDEKVLDTVLFLNKSEVKAPLKTFLSEKWDVLRDQELIVLLNGVDPLVFSLTNAQQMKLVNHVNSDVVQSFLRYLLKFSESGNFPLDVWKQLLNHPAKEIKFELIADIHLLKNVPEELKAQIKKTCEGASEFEMTEACRLWGFK